MWLTSIPSVSTLWLMANALALPIHTPTHTDGHTNRCAHQMPFAWIHMQICVSLCAFVCVWVSEMLKHFCGYDLPLAWRRISIILEKYTHSPVISPLLISHWHRCVRGAENERMTRVETERGREGQIETQAWRQWERAKGRWDESRTDKGNILPVIVCKNQSGKTDGNWVFDGLKETHRSIPKMAI